MLQEKKSANPKTQEIYVTDSMMNAVHAVTLDGTVRTLAQNGDTDGLDGGMDATGGP